MTIVELLQRKHHEVDALFSEVDYAAAASKYRLARATFRGLSIKLIASMRAVNAVVYPRFAFHARLAAEVTDASREHYRIERAINHIRIGALAPEEWRAAVRELRRMVDDHATAAECALFPFATLALTGDELRTIATEFLAYEPVAASVAGPSITYDTAA